MPSAGAGKGGTKERDGTAASAERPRQFEAELKAMVETHINHPSIIMWVVFNEGWGQYDTPRLTRWVKELDPTRLVNNASGWHDRSVGRRDRHARLSRPGLARRRGRRAPPCWASSADWVWAWTATRGSSKSWGYRGVPDQRALTRKYLELWREVARAAQEKGLSAAVYTQITDVETECNGLLTYDRQVVKVDAEQSHAALVRGQFPALPRYRTIASTAREETVVWRYTTDRPGKEWFQPGFDASAWKEGAAGFGTRGRRASKCGVNGRLPTSGFAAT